MASSPIPQPNKLETHDDDFYCSDPTCAYCKDLRVTQEQWKLAQEEERKRADAA
jgi:hypothetical protein